MQASVLHRPPHRIAISATAGPKLARRRRSLSHGERRCMHPAVLRDASSTPSTPGNRTGIVAYTIHHQAQVDYSTGDDNS